MLPWALDCSQTEEQGSPTKGKLQSTLGRLRARRMARGQSSNTEDKAKPEGKTATGAGDESSESSEGEPMKLEGLAVMSTHPV